jgi:hypothetical protein
MSAQLQPVTRAVRQIAIRPGAVGPPPPPPPRSLLTLLHSSARERTPSSSFTIVCALFAETPGGVTTSVSSTLQFASVGFFSRNSFRSNTCSRPPRFAEFWPRSSASNPFRCNSYRVPVRNPFIRNTYKNQGEGVPPLAARQLVLPSSTGTPACASDDGNSSRGTPHAAGPLPTNPTVFLDPTQITSLRRFRNV